MKSFIFIFLGIAALVWMLVIANLLARGISTDPAPDYTNLIQTAKANCDLQKGALNVYFPPKDRALGIGIYCYFDDKQYRYVGSTWVPNERFQ